MNKSEHNSPRVYREGLKIIKRNDLTHTPGIERVSHPRLECQPSRCSGEICLSGLMSSRLLYLRQGEILILSLLTFRSRSRDIRQSAIKNTEKCQQEQKHTKGNARCFIAHRIQRSLMQYKRKRRLMIYIPPCSATISFEC